MTHVLACALCSSNPQSDTNWLWTAAGFIVFGVILIVVAGWDARHRKARR